MKLSERMAKWQAAYNGMGINSTDLDEWMAEARKLEADVKEAREALLAVEIFLPEEPVSVRMFAKMLLDKWFPKEKF